MNRNRTNPYGSEGRGCDQLHGEMASNEDKLKRSSSRNSLEFIEELMKFIKADNHVGTNELLMVYSNDCSPQGGLLISQRYLSYYIILSTGGWQKDMLVVFFGLTRHTD
jgi:hypothetical protein